MSETETLQNYFVYEPLKDTWTRMTKENFRQYLTHMRLDFPAFPKYKGGFIQHNETISSAFKKLIEGKTWWLPVMSGKKAISLLTLTNLMHFFLSQFKDEDFNEKHFTSLLEGKKHQLLSQTVEEFLNNKENELDHVYSIANNKTLYDVFQLMVETGTHRVLVNDAETGDFDNVVTQSRILDFISCMMDFIPETRMMLADLNIGGKDIISVEETDSALSAFRLMRDKKISGVAVVNTKGELVGNISITDLKLVNYDMSYFGLLGVSVREYLNRIDRTALKPPFKPSHIQQIMYAHLKQQDPNNPPSVIKCSLDSTLALVIKLMTFYRVRRVYVCDKGLPVAVVSQTDVLRTISKVIQEQSP